MSFISRRVLKKKHYAVYSEAKDKVKTKARLLKEALKIALKEGKHEKWISFIPARFVLQLHGWVSKDSDLKQLKDVQRIIKQALKENKDRNYCKIASSTSNEICY